MFKLVESLPYTHETNATLCVNYILKKAYTLNKILHSLNFLELIGEKQKSMSTEISRNKTYPRILKCVRENKEIIRIQLIAIER